jgi:predicted RNA-binding Zn-ribbon protein involved in translation (DUF1610 family)
LSHPQRDGSDSKANCPSCHQQLDLRLDAAGVEINDFPCPHCGHEIHIVPAPPGDTGFPEVDLRSAPC